MLSTFAAPPFPGPVTFQDVDPEILAVEETCGGSQWQDFISGMLPSVAGDRRPMFAPGRAADSPRDMAAFLLRKDAHRALGLATAMRSSSAAIGDADREAFWAAVITEFTLNAVRN